MSDSILIIDFGSQVTQLIARRLREAGVFAEILPCTTDPKKIIISGPQIWNSTYTTNVTVEYTQPTGANRLRDAAGNFLATFNASTITFKTRNNSLKTTCPIFTIPIH